MDRTGRTSRRLVIVIGSAMIALGVAVTPAIAQAPISTDGDEHCVVTIIDQAPDGEYLLSDQVCFPTFDESVEYRTSRAETDG